MELRRFYASHIDNDLITIDGEEFYHCTKVTRHKVGYDLIINIGDGKDYISQIIVIEKDHLIAKVKEIIDNDSQPRCRVILYQGICKELDFIVQKAVELGVTDIQPFYSQRTNIRQINMPRMQKIIVEASKQCGRSILPVIHQPISYADAIERSKDIYSRILCYEKNQDGSIQHVINNAGKVDKNKLVDGVAIYIGSEGGFSQEEIDMAKQSGVSVVSLGRRILRAETATIVAVTLVMSAIGEL